MITLYVPLRANGKSRDVLMETMREANLVDNPTPFFVIKHELKWEKTGEDSLNEISLTNNIGIVATSAPAACGIGQIAPNCIDKTVLVIILGVILGTDFEPQIKYAVARNRPDEVLALVRGWSNHVHENATRGFLSQTHNLPLKVYHLDQ